MQGQLETKCSRSLQAWRVARVYGVAKSAAGFLSARPAISIRSPLVSCITSRT